MVGAGNEEHGLQSRRQGAPFDLAHHALLGLLPFLYIVDGVVNSDLHGSPLVGVPDRTEQL